MANKREFKKYVDAIGAAMYGEMMTAYYNIDGIDKDAVAKAIEKVLGAVGSAKNNSNIYFDRGFKAFGGDHKAYRVAKENFFKSLFAKIETEFNDSINEALKLFNGAVPAAVKEANKA